MAVDLLWVSPEPNVQSPDRVHGCRRSRRCPCRRSPCPRRGRPGNTGSWSFDSCDPVALWKTGESQFWLESLKGRYLRRSMVHGVHVRPLVMTNIGNWKITILNGKTHYKCQFSSYVKLPEGSVDECGKAIRTYDGPTSWSFSGITAGFFFERSLRPGSVGVGVWGKHWEHHLLISFTWIMARIWKNHPEARYG